MVQIDLKDDWIVTISGDVTAHEATALVDGLKALLATGQLRWMLDLSGVTALDTAGVQILLSFKKSVGAMGVQLCPERERRFLEDVGLAVHLL